MKEEPLLPLAVARGSNIKGVDQVASLATCELRDLLHASRIAVAYTLLTSRRRSTPLRTGTAHFATAHWHCFPLQFPPRAVRFAHKNTTTNKTPNTQAGAAGGRVTARGRGTSQPSPWATPYSHARPPARPCALREDDSFGKCQRGVEGAWGFD